MATFNRAQLKAFFETGDFPTEGEFGDWFDSIPLWTKTTKLFSDFQPNATDTNQIVLFSAAAGSTPQAVKFKHSASFTGGATNSAFITVEAPDGITQFGGLDVFQAPGNTIGEFGSNLSGSTLPDQVAASNYLVTLFITGDIIDNLTAGSVDVWLLEGPVT